VPREAIQGSLTGVLLLVASGAIAATPLKVELDKSRVDLAAHKLEVRMNHAPGHVEVKVFGTGAEAPLVENDVDFHGHAPGEALTVTWSDPGADVARIDVRAYDSDGAYVGLALLPWSISIPHEEVTFATDSATIAPAEVPKLEASHKLITEALVKYREIGAIKLFIAGQTDSVGAAAYNLKLSMRRAQAIAGWFRKRGLKVPVLFEGFGEQALRVPTPDQTDEPRNRRVDYFLAVDEPQIKTTNFRPVWKRAP
jgi:outer membrane protein OmpA-like peptidoglycan-associated protein